MRLFLLLLVAVYLVSIPARAWWRFYVWKKEHPDWKEYGL